MSQKIPRRRLLKGAAVVAASAAAGTLLASCQAAPQVVKETVVVEKEVEKVVTQVVEKEVPKEVTKVVEKVVEAPPATGPTNALGVTLPADALPLDQQYIRAAIGQVGGGYGHIMESLYNRAFEHAGGAETLTTLDPDFELMGIGAESWTVSDDGSYWDFKLRKELVFSDGSPVTAHDWVYTMRWSLSRGYDFAWYYFDIKNAQKVTAGELPPEELGMEAIDDYTLRVYTEAPVPYLPAVFIWFQVAKKDIWETAGENWALDPKRYVSSGPFILTQFERGVRHKWELVPTYKGVRRPYMVEIREETLPSGLPAYIAGELQTYTVSAATPAAEIALINANPILRAESHPGLPTNTDYMGFNTLGEFEPLTNPDVRLALCKAIDKEELVGQIFQGFSYPAWGILPRGFPNYNEALKDLDINKYDPEAARQLLSKAGYPDGRGFPKYEVWIRMPSSKLNALCQAIQARWKENLGIEVDLRPSDFQSFTDTAFRQKKAPIYVVNYDKDYFDPATFLNIFRAGGRHPHEDEAWTEFYNKANSTLDPQKRLEDLKTAEKMLVESTAYYFLHSPFVIQLWHCNLKGEWAEPNKDGYTFFGGAPGMPHAYEKIYWSDSKCREGLR